MCWLSYVRKYVGLAAPVLAFWMQTGLLEAQTNPPAASPPETGDAGNLLPKNGWSWAPERLGNYWDGVDSDNHLRVHVTGSQVLDDAGRMRATQMSSCPNFVDMNGDGLKDLVVSDTYGFIWIYINSGEPGKPKFTTGEFLQTFVGWCAKIHVCDWDNDGDNDIVVGTFYGDIAFLENIGNARQYQFVRRSGSPRYVDPQFEESDPRNRLVTLKLGKKDMVLGNYMSPWVADWNNSGKHDLILGEGTYSANSVRLLVNTGSRNRPEFLEDRVFYLAFGEGYEQLTPAVVDYNGDGINDLIFGTRTGPIRMYKGTQDAKTSDIASIRGTRAPAILECEGTLQIEGRDAFDKMTFPFPCDWNDDGLFDLLLGSTKGKIYIAINKGTKEKPHFPKAEPVTGTDVEKDLLAPAGWWPGYGRMFWSNFIGGFCNAATLLSLEKELVLRQGMPAVTPVTGQYFLYFRYVNNYVGYTQNRLSWVPPIISGTSINQVRGGRFISPTSERGTMVRLKLKTQYEFSFSSIVEGKPVKWAFWTYEQVKGATDFEADQWKYWDAADMIPVSTTWQKRTYRFRAPHAVQSNQSYNLYFRMPEGEGKLLLDDLSLREVKR